MANTLITGPSIVAGGLLSVSGAPEYNPDNGPSISFQGDCLPDVRYPINKDYLDRGGQILSHLNNPYFVVLDVTPQTASTTAIAAAANVTNGTAMTLATAITAGAYPNVPLVPQGASAPVFATGIELGFTSGNTTAGNATISSIPAAGMLGLYVGQWLIIPGAGNSGNTSALICQVTSIASATSITVSPSPAGSVSGARLCQGNVFNALWGATANGVVNYAGSPLGGPAAVLDPTATCARCISITGSASATGGNFLVRGYDLYGYSQSELVTGPVGTATTYSKKCFKWVTSVTPQFTDAHNYSVGFGDDVEFPIRADLWEYLTVFYAGAAITSSTGFRAADTTNPATTTTTSPRGSLAIGSLNNAGTGVSGGAFNGTRRLVVAVTLPLRNLLAGYGPSASSSIYGVTPV